MEIWENKMLSQKMPQITPVYRFVWIIHYIFLDFILFLIHTHFSRFSLWSSREFSWPSRESSYIYEGSNVNLRVYWVSRVRLERSGALGAGADPTPGQTDIVGNTSGGYVPIYSTKMGGKGGGSVFYCCSQYT